MPPRTNSSASRFCGGSLRRFSSIEAITTPQPRAVYMSGDGRKRKSKLRRSATAGFARLRGAVTRPCFVEETRERLGGVRDAQAVPRERLPVDEVHALTRAVRRRETREC